MGRLFRALFAAAVVTGAAYLILRVNEASPEHRGPRPAPDGLMDEDDLSQAEKDALMTEMSSQL